MLRQVEGEPVQDTLSPLDRAFYFGERLHPPRPTHPCPVCGRPTIGATKVDALLASHYDDRCVRCRDRGWSALSLPMVDAVA